MHTTPNGCIIWYFFFDSLFLKKKKRGKAESEKSYDPVYVACLIKKREKKKRDTLEERPRTPSHNTHKKMCAVFFVFFCPSKNIYTLKKEAQVHHMSQEGGHKKKKKFYLIKITTQTIFV